MNIKKIDWIIIAGLILAVIIGALTFFSVRQTADKQIEATSKIMFQVFLRSVTITSKDEPIKTGDKTFITIRNVPYTELEVTDVKMDNKKVVVPLNKAKEPFIVTNDLGQVAMYDILVTIVDTAKITKDGAVVGGNKIKIGLPVTLEGENYKFNGNISNVQVIQDNAHFKNEYKMD